MVGACLGRRQARGALGGRSGSTASRAGEKSPPSRRASPKGTQALLRSSFPLLGGAIGPVTIIHARPNLSGIA